MPTIQNRRATAAQWTAANPVLAAGEIGFELDTNRLKVGDGLTPWSTLSYLTDESLSDLIESGRLSEAALNDTYAPLGVYASVVAARPRSTRFAEVERQQSYARAATRSAAGVALPAKLTLLTLPGGVSARVSFPDDWSYLTPIPVVMQFKGLGAAPNSFLRDEMVAKANQMGFAVAVADYGNTYGSQAGLNVARELYLKVMEMAPVSGVVLWGNSMGGASALNALTTGTFPDPLGIYLTDPVVSLRQRYDAGQAATIRAAYGIASDGSNYDEKTEGYDPALRPPEDFRGTPISVVASTNDGTVPLASHGRVLHDKLAELAPVDLLDTMDWGHTTNARFDPAHFGAFLLSCVGSWHALPTGPKYSPYVVYTSDSFNRADTAPGTLGVTDCAYGGEPKPWTAESPLQIIGNQVGAVSLTAAKRAILDVGTSDCYVEIVLSADREGGVEARYSDASNKYAVRVHTGGTISLEAMVAGNNDLYTSTAANTAQVGDRIGLLCRGTTVAVYRNRQQVLVRTGENRGLTGTKVAIRSAWSNAAAKLDDFLVASRVPGTE